MNDGIKNRLDAIADVILREVQSFEHGSGDIYVREVFLTGEGECDKVSKVTVVSWDKSGGGAVAGEAKQPLRGEEE